MNDLMFLHFKKLRDGRWEAYDKNGRTAIGSTKGEAKRLFYLYYELPRTPLNGQARSGLIPTENLTLDR